MNRRFFLKLYIDCRHFIGRKLKIRRKFPGSAKYWEKRYFYGGNSGCGSYGGFAEFKAEVLNGFVDQHGVRTVAEFGCGDGNQLSIMKYPYYVGFDVSETAVAECRRLFKHDDSKSFHLLDEYNGQRADLTLSLDVIYHLVEDDVYYRHMELLFDSSDRFVIIYSTDSEDNEGNDGTHVWNRKCTEWVKENMPNWKLIDRIPNRYKYDGDWRKGSAAEFFVYEMEK